MSMDVRKVKLDFNRTYQHDIPSVQGDTGRSIEFQIINVSVAEDITGETVKIFGLKPDGYRVFNNAKITDARNGKCVVDLTLQMLCVAGIVQCTLVRYKNGEKLSSRKFNIEVSESVADDIEIESTSEYLALTDALGSIGSGGATKEEVRQLEAEISAIKNEIGTETLPTTAKTLKGAIAETFQSVSNGKKLIASAITDKGVTTSNTDSFQTMANNILNISSTQGSEGNKDPYRKDRILVWEDDFNGESLDTSIWNYELGNIRPNELQVYTNNSKNVYLENSNLVLKAIKEDCVAYDKTSQSNKTFHWTSGSITTNNTKEFKYGRFEAKIKIPKTLGSFPAFWTLGAGYDYQYTNNKDMGNKGVLWPFCGEIDIMEHYGAAANTTHGSLYSTSETITNATNLGRLTSKTLDFDEYHIYSLEWTENKIELFVDDVLVSSSDITDVFEFASFHTPHFILFDHAIGGAGGTPVSSLTECYMYIDWVRIYAPNNHKVEKITLNKSKLSISNVGDTKILTASFSPENAFDQTVKWKSSAPDIATVYGGKVKAIKDGSCVITATSGDISTSCSVTVGANAGTDPDPIPDPTPDIGDDGNLTFHFNSSDNTDISSIFTTTTDSISNCEHTNGYNSDGYLEIIDRPGKVSSQDGYVRIEPIGYSPTGNVIIQVNMSVDSYRDGSLDTEGVRIGVDNGTKGIYISLTPNYGIRYMKGSSMELTDTKKTSLNADEMFTLKIKIDFANNTNAEIYYNGISIGTVAYSNWTTGQYVNRNNFYIMARNAKATVNSIKILNA